MLQKINAKILAVVAVLALIAVVFVALDDDKPTKTATAFFPRAVSIYPDTEVRILGVKIGRVTSVTPDGESVRVAMEYDADYKIPADAKAVIVTPTLVADRFIQLTPVYESGPTLADGAKIALPNTGVPVELDRIYSSLRDLSVALGPNGVNKDGSLNRLLSVAAKQLEGKGAKGNKMIRSLAQAAETFGSSSGDLFETVENLAAFTETLAANDELVNAFVKDLAGVSADLADERQELEAALAAVANAVGTVKTFVADNRKGVSTNIKRLTKAVKAVASQKEELNRALFAGPVAIGNLNASYDVRTGSQNSRFSFAGNIARFDQFLCALITQSDKISNALTKTACSLFQSLLTPVTSQVLGRTAPGEKGKTNPKAKPEAEVRPDVTDYDSNTNATLADLMGGS
ncbi:MCE family protein [Nocardioides sp. Bht2]|uniref:MCE family protein n=1 Tax=Nocardioides sp. Bht2 TaxID=3392297 RepID=UPI0039B670DD